MEPSLSFVIMGYITAVINNAVYIISMLLIVLVAACFLGRYVVLTRKLVISSLGILALTIITTIVANILFGDEADTDTLYWVSFVSACLIFIYAFIFYLFAFKEKRFLRAVESTICMYLFCVYVNTISQMTAIYMNGGTEEVVEEVFDKSLGTGVTWYTIIMIDFIITATLFLLVYFGFYKPKKYYVIGIPYRIFFVIWTFIFSVVPFIPAVVPSDECTLENRYHLMSIIFALGIIIIGLAIPVFLIVSTTARSFREKNKYQESYIEAELEYIGQYKKQQTETKAFRHDIKNNLALTQMMLEKGQNEEAKAHIADMLGNVSSLSPKYITGDEMLDLIVFMKADKMEEKNIQFTLDGIVDGGLKLKPMDMCSIFANALDNAIEAASSCEDPYVKFSIKRTDKFFVLKITNSAKGKVDAGKLLVSSGYTSKEDKEHHGFGLMNVRRAVESYNGILKAESEDSSFTLSIILPRGN